MIEWFARIQYETAKDTDDAFRRRMIKFAFSSSRFNIHTYQPDPGCHVCKLFNLFVNLHNEGLYWWDEIAKIIRVDLETSRYWLEW